MAVKMKSLVVALTSAAISASASAATISLNGGGFSVSWDDSVSSLFGAPTLVGNNLTFNPTAFGVSSITNAWSTLVGTFNMTVSAWSGYQLDSVGFVDGGSYALLGAGAKTAVGTSLFVTPYDSVGIEAFSGSSGASGNGIGYGSWTLGEGESPEVTGLAAQSANVGLSMFLAANGGSADNFASVNVSAAKLSFGVVPVAPVPEPEAYLMLLTGLGMVGVIARRRAAVR